ncbi:amino acid ABC transporter substrate-binding protein (PAAT family) [Aliiruegeria haliotis]|uniref:Amino acid ABC transporter substrate-binding protein (PAAT family) n=1 Tax=Aliiruegeria haliotis TaxID=1280846 RepID=A0A2T0RRN4_9RHOB|nr:transporter substrate-binding domain-containing protein [Aliiruegeria haliotis]PRY23859.1 amino acid ABC transporter substrate-binding protein (PAAT family) [Aliiruegeria haliotis]
MKTSVRLLGSAVLALLVATPGIAGETLDRVMSEGKLVMSSDPAYPPQSFLNDANEMDGFDIDVGKEVAKRLGVELEIVTPSWDIITAGRWNGRWDVSIGSMTPTAQRAQVLGFPAIYYYVPAAFAVHNDSAVSSIAELSGKTIGVCGGCTYDAYLQKNLVIDAEGVPAFDYQVTAGEIRTYDTDTSAYDDLRIGDGKRLDAVMSAMPTILEAQKNNYPMKIVGDPAFYEPLAVATDKGDEAFDAKIAEVVQAMHDDGTLTALSEKWFGVDYTSVK